MTELSASELHQLTTELAAGERTWADTDLKGRRELVLEMIKLVDAHAEEWATTAARLKGLDADSPLVGEEWISGPWAVLSYLQALSETLEHLIAGTDPLAGLTIGQAPGGRVAIDVLPANIFDTLLLNGFGAQVWLEPGVSLDETRSRLGLGSRTPSNTHGVALVLGAGNITSIAPLDVLYQLYADNRVAILKLNPTTDSLFDVFQKMFAPFIKLGVVRIVTGGIPVGTALANDENVTALHITGSNLSHDAIVWGVGEQGVANKKAGTPVLDKPITSELGGVCPVIVVPGKWSTADIEFQAQHVATQRLHNDGHNCIAAQILIVSSDWDQRAEFLAAVERAMKSAPVRPAWYPGTADRVAAARSTYGSCAAAVGGIPERTVISGLDPAAAEAAYSTEYFAPVLGVTELPGQGADFLRTAVDFANDSLSGTLGANIIVDPKALKAIGSAAFDDAVTDLRYGTIGINAWTGVGYLTPRATWGAFPGHTLDDIGSGLGVVHNALLLDRVERTVVRGPFRPAPRTFLTGAFALSPKPPWFVNNHTAAHTGKLLTRFSADPSWAKLPGIFASALRG